MISVHGLTVGLFFGGSADRRKCSEIGESVLKRTKNTLFSIKVHFFRIFLPKNLHISKIFSTFVPDLEKELKLTI